MLDNSACNGSKPWTRAFGPALGTNNKHIIVFTQAYEHIARWTCPGQHVGLNANGQKRLTRTLDQPSSIFFHVAVIFPSEFFGLPIRFL
jgi:hypothetical protein